MKKERSRTVSPRLAAQLDALAEMPDDQIDTTDIPEITDWSGAKRGLFYRPIKKQLTLRLDADVVDWFKSNADASGGRGYQTRINRALREYVSEHSRVGARRTHPNAAYTSRSSASKTARPAGSAKGK